MKIACLVVLVCLALASSLALTCTDMYDPSHPLPVRHGR